MYQMKNKLQVKIPGKLYVAGEYAVVESGHTAILTAVNRYITLTLEDSERNELWIPHYENPVSWPVGGELKPDGEHWTFTAEAINIATTFLKSEGIELTPVKMMIETELIDKSGAKYGLGSSAAATVAVINALMTKFYPEISMLKKFKLAALSHLVVQGNGSCGDIASCMYGGWIAYTTFDQEWVKHRLAYKSLEWFMKEPWPLLEIETLEEPTSVFSVGWTGTPVSTGKLVSQIHAFKQEDSENYQQFLTRNNQIMKQIIQAFHTKDEELLYSSIKENRRILQDLGTKAGVNIETNLLKKLADLAEQNDGAGKSSGSGGGDCGIAFSKTPEIAGKLVNEWEKLGIKHLPFNTGKVQITE
ncbi:phosphomevalonate kinase [Listeria seeligeri]|uniref:phosphomevalonate kinase n=1 Tax=Listeria seeligeri TaxID=1640 RepID=UPI0010E11D58|nr:phosphomevalonate kinase [Listeria seeligeri]MBC1420460.1 phosphomevalonate kinase [Listeria seeligeri]MBC1429575.1 phosphomevalonate kinase [Listeria seeligeri]MBC1479515.1 phosphomevalonate kinase [Listeria seeligeri]MBC1526884.1 phosphomevalonate kinase [Listeria seeligeri]MBC1720423.1 phosphomevalonate kinase [Listeria seeligeri]